METLIDSDLSLLTSHYYGEPLSSFHVSGDPGLSFSSRDAGLTRSWPSVCVAAVGHAYRVVGAYLAPARPRKDGHPRHPSVLLLPRGHPCSSCVPTTLLFLQLDWTDTYRKFTSWAVEG